MYRIIPIIILLFTVNISADSKIYLLPEVERGGESLKMSHISVIEGSDAGSIYELEIPGSYVKGSGIIDKSDIYEIISGSGYSGFIIFGNGVRINPRVENYSLNVTEKEYAVKKGESVDIVVLKNGIRIELQGESISQGEIGETVRVMAAKKRILTGIVAGKRRVVLELK